MLFYTSTLDQVETQHQSALFNFSITKHGDPTWRLWFSFVISIFSPLSILQRYFWELRTDAPAFLFWFRVSRYSSRLDGSNNKRRCDALTTKTRLLCNITLTHFIGSISIYCISSCFSKFQHFIARRLFSFFI